MNNTPIRDVAYLKLLHDIKVQVRQSHRQLAHFANSRLLHCYWQIGRRINDQVNRHGWGAKILDQLVLDLKTSFSNTKGFSKRNLQYMRKFAREWPIMHQDATPMEESDNEEDRIVQHDAAQLKLFEKHAASRIPWSHHLLLLDKLSSMEDRLFYCRQIAANNWSRKVLLNQLSRRLHLSQGGLSNNFNQTLPPDQYVEANQAFKDPYFFDFLGLSKRAAEKDLEERLIQRIEAFLLELGTGFAYLGRQYKLEVGGRDFYLDLLFFHTRLNCYVNIELKMDEFKPEYAGKSQFYLTAINKQLKLEFHNPTIGIILCKEANKIIVEYALKETKVPLGVAEYHLLPQPPGELRNVLPTAEQFRSSLRIGETE